MKALSAFTFAAAVLVVSPEASSRQPSPSCVSVGGTIAASIIETESGQAVIGSVTGTLRGAVRGIVEALEPQPDGSLRLDVLDHFVTEEGHVLETRDDVHLVPVPGREGVFHQLATYEVVSGTGKFERARGSFTGHGEADIGRGQVTVRYEGELCGVRR